MNENIRVDHLPSDTNITYWFDQYGAATGFRFMKRERIESIINMLEGLWRQSPADKPYYADDNFSDYPFGHGWGMF